MPVTSPRYNGKLKREIAREAFTKFGRDATFDQVNEHFRAYGTECSRATYQQARSWAECLPKPVPPKYRLDPRPDLADMVLWVREMAVELGSYDNVIRLVNVVRS